MSDMCPLGHHIPADVFRCSICGMPRLPSSAASAGLPPATTEAPSVPLGHDPFAPAPVTPTPAAALPESAPEAPAPIPAQTAPPHEAASWSAPPPVSSAEVPPPPPAWPDPAPTPSAEWPPAPTPLTPYNASDSRRPVNQLALLLVIAAAALGIGSLTPWVTVFGIGLSGVSIHYGIVSLVTAAAVGILVYLRSVQPQETATRICAIVVAVGGALSIASAVYVGWAIRSSFGSPDDSSDLAEAFVKALSPGIGMGLWLALAGGIAALVLALPLALDRKMSRGPW